MSEQHHSEHVHHAPATQSVTLDKRAQSLALTELENTVMWANASIARNS